MNDTPIDMYELQDQEIRKTLRENKALKSLCARAADALESGLAGGSGDTNKKFWSEKDFKNEILIADLRKVAE